MTPVLMTALASTALDTPLTPVLFWLFGEKATRQRTQTQLGTLPGAAGTQEAH